MYSAVGVPGLTQPSLKACMVSGTPTLLHKSQAPPMSVHCIICIMPCKLWLTLGTGIHCSR